MRNPQFDTWILTPYTKRGPPTKRKEASNGRILEKRNHRCDGADGHSCRDRHSYTVTNGESRDGNVAAFFVGHEVLH